MLFIFLVVPMSYWMETFWKERGLETGSIISVLDQYQPAALMGMDVLRRLDKQNDLGSANTIGPSLVSVLAAAGVSGFDYIEVKGIRSRAVYQITKDELSDQYILVFTDHNTVNLSKGSEGQTLLVQDISEIHAIR